MQARLLISLLFAAFIPASALCETVTGRDRPASPDPTYVFTPASGAKVELTLVWTKRAVNLDMLVRCFDEIGSEFFTGGSESGQDRFERMEFGGWFGSFCTVSVYSTDPGVRTRYYLNLQFSRDEPLPRQTEGQGSGLIRVGLDSIPGQRALLGKRKAARRARR